jgi:hypothetical protein
MSKDERYMKHMGELLVFHKMINQAEDLTEDNFDELIMEFQERAEIMVDGDPGWETLWHLQYPWVLQNRKLLFVRCEADKIPGSQGYDYLLLREDAAENFRALRREIVELGGAISSAGGKRSLSVGASAGRSSTSMHYPGLAFDLAIDSGFFKPTIDRFVITRGEDGYWNVWCRAEGGREKKLNAVYWDGWGSGVDKEKTVQGTFINFTELCIKHGFHPIRPRKSFSRPSGRKYLGCEWWHFQASDLLTPRLSQFGIELLKIEDYTPEHIQAVNENIWSRKRVIYRIDWF